MLKKSYSNVERLSLENTQGTDLSSAGLLGFGLSTVFFILFQAGFFSADAWIFTVGIVYGGVTQILAGLRQWQKKQFYGSLACVAYGLFWLSLVGFVVLPDLGLGTQPQATIVCAYYFLWFLFTVLLLSGEAKFCTSFRAAQVFLAGYFVLFVISVACGSSMAQEGSFYLGIISGLVALYSGLATLVNRLFGQLLLPIGYPN